MSEAGWTALTVAAIGAFGTAFSGVILQALQMYLSYKRDLAIKTKAESAVKEAKEAKEKLNNDVEQVKKKIDDNTAITTQAKDAAQAAESQTNGVMHKYHEQITNQGNRIVTLEKDLGTLKILVESTAKEVSSTRHEVRGHLQTITNKLDLMHTSVPTRTELK